MRWTKTRHLRFWIAFMVCWTVAANATPIAATGELAASIAREATRIAGNPQTGSAADTWSRVRRLDSGSSVIVTARSGRELERHVIGADELGLTMLNASDSPLPLTAKDILIRVASQHPEYFSSAQQGGTVVLDGHLRLRRDGVFVGDRRVADLGRVIENIARVDITEIRARRLGRGLWGHLGPLGGYFVGAMSGGLVAGLPCQAAAGRARCDSAAALGMFVGAVGGGVYGFHAARRETEEVIYQAP